MEYNDNAIAKTAYIRFIIICFPGNMKFQGRIVFDPIMSRNL